MASKLKRLLARCRDSEGFTLVELLVALALFSLLSLALFGSVRIGTIAWVRGTSHAEETDAGIVTRDLLRRLIENAYPFFLSEDPSRRHVDFEGRKDSLEFLTDGPMALGVGGRSRVSLSVEHQHGGFTLMLISHPELGIADDQTTTVRRPLLREVSAVDFLYFGKTQSDSAMQWHDRWSAEKELPRLVRVHVQFPADEGRRWPDLIAKPRILADVGCVLDRVTMQCQGR